MLNRLALTGQADRISGARVKKRKSCILWVVKSVRGGGAAAGGGTITGHGGHGTRVADVASAPRGRAQIGGGSQIAGQGPDDRQVSRLRIQGARD